MLDNIRNRFREGTISRELRHLAETTSLLNGVQNNFYKGLRHRRREFREFVDTRSVTPPTRDELRYYAQVALHSYQYAMLKHTELMILPIMYPEGNIAQSLDSIFQSANAANTFFESFRKPVSRSKPHRYVPLKGLLSGTMKHLDIGGGVIPSANYLHSAVSDEDLHNLIKKELGY